MAQRGIYGGKAYMVAIQSMKKRHPCQSCLISKGPLSNEHLEFMIIGCNEMVVFDHYLDQSLKNKSRKKRHITSTEYDIILKWSWQCLSRSCYLHQNQTWFAWIWSPVTDMRLTCFIMSHLGPRWWGWGPLNRKLGPENDPDCFKWHNTYFQHHILTKITMHPHVCQTDAPFITKSWRSRSTEGGQGVWKFVPYHFPLFWPEMNPIDQKINFSKQILREYIVRHPITLYYHIDHGYLTPLLYIYYVSFDDNITHFFFMGKIYIKKISVSMYVNESL